MKPVDGDWMLQAVALAEAGIRMTNPDLYSEARVELDSLLDGVHDRQLVAALVALIAHLTAHSNTIEVQSFLDQVRARLLTGEAPG
jgi:hypothetical protein